jgi:serine/threonine protein kinase
MLVYEIKFARSLLSYEHLYNIQLLRCMDDVPGFAKLVSVVINTSGNYLKSYLIGFPGMNSLFLSNEVVQGRLIPWKRREKLARQLVEAVRQVHFKGFVMGGLMSSQARILIDSSNCLHFWEFKKKFRMGYRRGCYYPPEFRHYQYLSRSTTEAECPNVTPKTDIFHLGMALWYIAEGFPRGRVSPVCMREGCDTQPSCFCSDESHIDPIVLPSLSESIPQYYRDIVNDCRAEDPNERPAAWRLLDRFPCTSESECSQIQDPEPKNIDLESLLKNFARSAFCDVCRAWIEKSYFHCNVCLSGDFDICLACYNVTFRAFK